MMTDDTLRFLTALFPEVPLDRRILVWTMPGKKSHWCADAAEAAAVCAKVAPTHNVYVGGALRAAGLGVGQRGTSQQVTDLCALWVDLDVVGPGHSRPGLPPSIDAAHIVLAEMPMRPSIVVSTGGGLQAWWLLQEPLALGAADSAEREHARQVLLGWNRLLIAKCQARGWACDNVGTLDHVLRVPGTWNRKGRQPVPVRVLEADEGDGRVLRLVDFP